MGVRDNIKVVQQMYEAFGRGDIPAILGNLAEGATMDHSGPPDVLPWAGPHRGREGWQQFFKDLSANLDYLAFEPRQYVAQGDKVVALGWWKARAKPTGRTFEAYWSMAWTLKGGKATDVRVYEDTAAVVAAMRKG